MHITHRSTHFTCILPQKSYENRKQEGMNSPLFDVLVFEEEVEEIFGPGNTLM